MTPKRLENNFNHEWHVSINKFTAVHGFDDHMFMYEAKAAADEIPRMAMLFEQERNGKLAKVHSQCCHKPEPIQENFLTCCLGIRCSECPMLKALDKIEGTDEQRDFAKAMTCATHIIASGGDLSNEGYLMTVDDRMYWDNVYSSLASYDESDDSEQVVFGTFEEHVSKQADTIIESTKQATAIEKRHAKMQVYPIGIKGHAFAVSIALLPFLLQAVVREDWRRVAFIGIPCVILLSWSMRNKR